MSTRYGIGLALEPGFTSRAYRARQLICGQYASWAAEMNMVYLTVSGFFTCEEGSVLALEAGLDEVASHSLQQAPQFPLYHNGVSTAQSRPGHVYLDFASPAITPPLASLHAAVASLLEEINGVEIHESDSPGPFQPHLPLLQYARLPDGVFGDAAEFARAVAADLQIPPGTQAWRLLLLRFESAAAGEDWSGGSWAADLSWELLASFPL